MAAETPQFSTAQLLDGLAVFREQVAAAQTLIGDDLQVVRPLDAASDNIGFTADGRLVYGEKLHDNEVDGDEVHFLMGFADAANPMAGDVRQFSMPVRCLPWGNAGNGRHWIERFSVRQYQKYQSGPLDENLEWAMEQTNGLFGQVYFDRQNKEPRAPFYIGSLMAGRNILPIVPPVLLRNLNGSDPASYVQDLYVRPKAKKNGVVRRTFRRLING